MSAWGGVGGQLFTHTDSVTGVCVGVEGNADCLLSLILPGPQLSMPCFHQKKADSGRGPLPLRNLIKKPPPFTRGGLGQGAGVECRKANA